MLNVFGKKAKSTAEHSGISSKERVSRKGESKDDFPLPTPRDPLFKGTLEAAPSFCLEDVILIRCCVSTSQQRIRITSSPS